MLHKRTERYSLLIYLPTLIHLEALHHIQALLVVTSITGRLPQNLLHTQMAFHYVDQDLGIFHPTYNHHITRHLTTGRHTARIRQFQAPQCVQTQHHQHVHPPSPQHKDKHQSASPRPPHLVATPTPTPQYSISPPPRHSHQPSPHHRPSCAAPFRLHKAKTPCASHRCRLTHETALCHPPTSQYHVPHPWPR